MLLQDILEKSNFNVFYIQLVGIVWHACWKMQPLKINLHPKNGLYENIDYMRDELKVLGYIFSTNKRVCNKWWNYTKWEQEFIIKMYEKEFYKKKSSGKVNWCPQSSYCFSKWTTWRWMLLRCDGTEVVQKRCQDIM